MCTRGMILPATGCVFQELVGRPVRRHDLSRDEAMTPTTIRMSRHSCPRVSVEMPVAAIETTRRFVPAVSTVAST
jgi:hypothetical protein